MPRDAMRNSLTQVVARQQASEKLARLVEEMKSLRTSMQSDWHARRLFSLCGNRATRSHTRGTAGNYRPLSRPASTAPLDPSEPESFQQASVQVECGQPTQAVLPTCSAEAAHNLACVLTSIAIPDDFVPQYEPRHRSCPSVCDTTAGLATKLSLSVWHLPQNNDFDPGLPDI